MDPGKEDPLPAEQKEGSLCRSGNGLGQMLFRFLNSEAHVRHPCDADMGLFLSCFTAGKTLCRSKQERRKAR